MATATTTELITGLRTLLEHAINSGEAIRLIAATLRDNGAVATLDVSDDEVDNDGDGFYRTSDHGLVIDGEPVSEWVRWSVGRYDGATWRVEEDADNDDLPSNVAIVLDVFGLIDELPDIPEPPRDDTVYLESPDGPYCVYWESACDGESRVCARYATKEAAVAVCNQWTREFAAKHPGNVLCGYDVRGLAGNKWKPIEE